MSLQKRILFAAFLCAGILGALYCFYDNTDREHRSLRANGVEIRMTPSGPEAAAIEDTIFDGEEVYDVEQDIFDNNFRDNECLTDFKAYQTDKEQLQNFAKGKCAPVIVLPGLMGTKLVAQIDCEVLAEKHPEIMSACGWVTCQWSMFAKRPASEYVIWLPPLNSPMNIVRVSQNTCFGKLVNIDYDRKNTNISEKHRKIEGVSITWYGNTPETAEYAKGGFGAVSNLLPVPVQTASSRQYHNMGLFLEKLGYQKGLSLFAVPYDFRLTHLANQVAYTLERTIKYAYELTGKKVIIIAHSLGNLNTLSVLSQMSQSDKDKMIASFVSLGAPFGGASKASRMLLGGAKEMLFLDFIGVQFTNQKKFIGSGSSSYDLLPKDTFFRFKNEQWMKDLVARIKLENTYPPNTEEGAKFWKTADKSKIPMPFFPTPVSDCFKHNQQNRPKECMTLASDLSMNPIAQIVETKYYASQSSIEDLIKEHYNMGSIEDSLSMYHDSLAAKIHELPNPQVPTVVVYGSHHRTEKLSHWDYYPNQLTDELAVAAPTHNVLGYGDGTVEVSTALPAALKWAWEHSQGIEGAKPIKIAEYCSEFNQKDSVWDAVDKNGVMVMNKSEYMAFPCFCRFRAAKGKDCNHARMPDDLDMIAYLARMAFTNQISDLKSTGAYKLSEDRVTELKSELPSLRRPAYEQNVREWLY